MMCHALHRRPGFARALGLLVGLVLGAPLPRAAAAATTSWPSGLGLHGTRGASRVESAVPLPAEALVVWMGGAYLSEQDLLVDGDTNDRATQTLGLVWSPIESLSLWLTQATVSNKNSAHVPRTTQVLGDPTVGLKLVHPLDRTLGVGAQLTVAIPTSAGGAGLAPNAASYSASLVGSYLVVPSLSLSANLGYLVDRSGNIFADDVPLTPAQRFTAGISLVNQVLIGVAAEAEFGLGERMQGAAFVELGGGLAHGAPAADSPIRATVGGRLMPFGKDALELTAGADVRLAGAPSRTKVSLPGIPMLEGFIRVAAHIGNAPAPVVSGPMTIAGPGPERCKTDAGCASGLSCVEELCTLVKESVRVETQEVVRPTFNIEGAVTAAASGEPIGSATLSFSGFDGSLLAVDYKSGKFRSWPILVGEGLIKVSATAPGFRPAEQTVPRGQAGEVKALAFKLQPTGAEASGELKGSLKDGRTGKPVRGELLLPSLSKKFRAEADGTFQATVKAGRYQVLLSAPGYATQKKEIEIRAGDVVILNVDLAPRR